MTEYQYTPHSEHEIQAAIAQAVSAITDEDLGKLDWDGLQKCSSQTVELLRGQGYDVRYLDVDDALESRWNALMAVRPLPGAYDQALRQALMISPVIQNEVELIRYNLVSNPHQLGRNILSLERSAEFVMYERFGTYDLPVARALQLIKEAYDIKF